MYAMQYAITLPADYDMDIIRRRVATRGHLTDTFDGLGLKAYAIRERGVDGSPVNQYAPFYLWHDITGMNRFLWGGGGFGGIVTDFGRPAVAHWIGVAYRPGPEHTTPPRTATVHTAIVPDDTDPAEPVEQALDDLRHRATTPGVHSTALAVDPRTWQCVHITLWTTPAPDVPGTRYRVLHLSAPNPHDLPTGRHR